MNVKQKIPTITRIMSPSEQKEKKKNYRSSPAQKPLCEVIDKEARRCIKDVRARSGRKDELFMRYNGEQRPGIRFRIRHLVAVRFLFINSNS